MTKKIDVIWMWTEYIKLEPFYMLLGEFFLEVNASSIIFSYILLTVPKISTKICYGYFQGIFWGIKDLFEILYNRLKIMGVQSSSDFHMVFKRSFKDFQIVLKRKMASLPVSNKDSGKSVIFVINSVFFLLGKIFISNTNSVSNQNCNFIIIFMAILF